MTILGRIGLALIVLPLAEVAAFVLVGSVVGFWTAVLLVLLTSLTGAFLLRLAGRPRLRRFGGLPRGHVEFSAETAGPGTFLVLVGILLLVPGFLTDIVGLLILLPVTRRRIGDFVNRAITNAVSGTGARQPFVDLRPDEWHVDRSPPHDPGPRALRGRRR